VIKTSNTQTDEPRTDSSRSSFL